MNVVVVILSEVFGQSGNGSGMSQQSLLQRRLALAVGPG